MITERIELSDLKKAAEILKCGGIAAIPTETVYGLAASAYSDTAIDNVFKAKGRPQDNPLIVHIANIETLGEIACDIPAAAYECARRFWPGPFTMVLKKTDKVCENVSRGLDTVAVRMPSDPVARAIIEKSGLPLAAPSANLSGKPSPTSALHVLSDLDGKIDAVVMGDDCTVGVESTVVSLCGGTPRLLRPGAVTLEQLQEVLPDITVDKAVLSEPEKGERVASPGMKYKHYSPAAELYLVCGDSEKYAGYVNKKNDGTAVCFSEDVPYLRIPFKVYGSKADERTLARGVFSALRELDGENITKAYVHAPGKTGVGLAVFNRLIRAAAFRVVEL